MRGSAAALVRLLAGANEIVCLAQPLRVHRFHLALGQPHKSHPYDAQVIAQLARQNMAQPPRLRLGIPDVQALRVLISMHHHRYHLELLAAALNCGDCIFIKQVRYDPAQARLNLLLWWEADQPEPSLLAATLGTA